MEDSESMSYFYDGNYYHLFQYIKLQLQELMTKEQELSETYKKELISQILFDTKLLLEHTETSIYENKLYRELLMCQAAIEDPSSERLPNLLRTAYHLLLELKTSR